MARATLGHVAGSEPVAAAPAGDSPLTRDAVDDDVDSDVNVSVNVTVRRRVKPIYPESERETGREGICAANVLVHHTGSVRVVSIKGCSVAFARAAAAALVQWQYAPFDVRGDLTSVRSVIRVWFKPD